MCCPVLSRLIHVRLFTTPWTVAHQSPLSMGFSRQEYWSGLPFPPPGDLPNPGIELVFLMSPALAGGFFLPLVPPGIRLVRVALRSICVTLQATVPAWGFPGGTGKESTCQCRRLGFNPRVGKIPWRRKQQPGPVSLPGKYHRQRGLEY